MFNYQGPSQGFREALEVHGNRLESVYRKILKPEMLENVTRLISSKLYNTPQRGHSPIQSVTSIQDDIINNCSTPEFLIKSLDLMLMDDHFVEELDRRVLLEIGYNPTLWLEARKGQMEDDAGHAQLQKHLRNLNSSRLMQYIIRWDLYINKEDKTLSNLVNSYQQYRIRKVSTQQIEDLEDVLSSSSGVGFGVDGDNYAGVIVLSPDTDKIQVKQGGKLFLKDTSNIVTAPFIILSEDGVEGVTSRQLQGSDIPPYLAAFMHEFHHFLLYVLQRHPMNLTASLLLLEATRQPSP